MDEYYSIVWSHLVSMEYHWYDGYVTGECKPTNGWMPISVTCVGGSSVVEQMAQLCLYTAQMVWMNHSISILA